MSLFRVKELCKERRIAMKDLAKMIGTSPSSLSQSLNNQNASLATLEKIAKCLGVDVVELFEPKTNTIQGSIFIGNTLYPIYNKQDIRKVLEIVEKDS